MNIPPFVSPVNIRDYQEEVTTLALEHLKKGKNPCICLPTGTGKTKTMMELLRRLWLQDMTRKFLIIVPSDELRTNSRQDAILFGIASAVDVETYQTLYRRYKQYSGYHLVINDECHGVAANTWTQVLEYFRSHGCKFLGLSATPERLDGKALDKFFDTLIQPYPVQWYEDHGYLAPVTMLTKEVASFVITQSNDDLEYQSKLLDTPEITGDAIAHWVEHAYGMKTLVFCSSVEHSENVAKKYNEIFYPKFGRQIAVALDAQSPKSFRRDTFDNFKKATRDQGFLILINVELFTTGVDIPDAKCCQLLRKTASPGLYNQMIGRVRRPTGETAIVLDHVGNQHLHGHPNFGKMYTLAGVTKEAKEKKEDKESEAYPVLCPDCSFSVSLTTTHYECFNCGWKMIRKKETVRGKKQPKQVDGILVEYKLHPAHGEASSILEKFKRSKNREGGSYKKGWMVYRIKEMYQIYPVNHQYPDLGFPDDLAVFLLQSAGYNESISRMIVGQIKANPYK